MPQVLHGVVIWSSSASTCSGQFAQSARGVVESGRVADAVVQPVVHREEVGDVPFRICEIGNVDDTAFAEFS
jgi:hypothetical protein